jgi:hypothetical protein
VHSKKILISLASSFRWVQISHKFPVSRRLPSSEGLQFYGTKEAIAKIFFPLNKVRPKLDTFPIEGQVLSKTPLLGAKIHLIQSSDQEADSLMSKTELSIAPREAEESNSLQC